MDRAAELAWTESLAKEAAELARSKFGHVERLSKTHATTTDETVTMADRLTQKLIVAKLREKFPSDGIIGEESETGDAITSDFSDANGRIWVIDPIDGTNNFVGGLEAFAVSIGLLEGRRPVLGVVHDIANDVVYSGATGVGAFRTRGSTRIQTRAHSTPLSDASLIMCTANAVGPRGHSPKWLHDLVDQSYWKLRMLGTAALEAVQVGAGVAHVAITVNGKLWDCVAPAAVVEAAGGKIVTLSGEPIFPFDLTNYAGKKVPFLALAPQTLEEFVKYIQDRP